MGLQDQTTLDEMMGRKRPSAPQDLMEIEPVAQPVVKPKPYSATNLPEGMTRRQWWGLGMYRRNALRNTQYDKNDKPISGMLYDAEQQKGSGTLSMDSALALGLRGEHGSRYGDFGTRREEVRDSRIIQGPYGRASDDSKRVRTVKNTAEDWLGGINKKFKAEADKARAINEAIAKRKADASKLESKYAHELKLAETNNGSNENVAGIEASSAQHITDSNNEAIYNLEKLNQVGEQELARLNNQATLTREELQRKDDLERDLANNDAKMDQLELEKTYTLTIANIEANGGAVNDVNLNAAKGYKSEVDRLYDQIGAMSPDDPQYAHVHARLVDFNQKFADAMTAYENSKVAPSRFAPPANIISAPPAVAQAAPAPTEPEVPPVDGARKAPDGFWYIQQADGKYYRVNQ